MNTWVVVGIVVVVLVLIGLAVWVWLRRRWIAEFRAEGWEFDDHPGIEQAYGLNTPPFGLGDDRKIKDLVRGRIDDVEFRALNYRCDGFGGWMAVFPLPRAYPVLQLGAVRPELTGHRVEGMGTPGGVTSDPAFARALVPSLAPALAPFGTLAPVAITVDGSSLTVGPLPNKAAEMKPYLSAGAGVARAITAAQADLSQFPAPPVPPELSVHGHPAWRFRVQDDQMLARVTYDRSGYDHEARRVIFCDDGPLPFVALTHHWKTRHTTTDSDGKTQTEVRNHDEDIIEFVAPQGFLDLSVNQWLTLRRPIRFESSGFNSQFKVRCDHDKFAHDVIHPRMMEFMQAANPPAFGIRDGRVSADIDYSVDDIVDMLHFLQGFFARVPTFVWKDLGYAQAPMLPPATEGGPGSPPIQQPMR